MHCQQHELSLSNKPKPIKAHHKLLYWNKMLLLLEQTVLFFPYLVLYFEFLFLKRRDNSDLNVNDWRKKKKPKQHIKTKLTRRQLWQVSTSRMNT